MPLIAYFLATTKQALFIIAGLFGIGFIIGFHELGHFIFCKLFGIRTPSFSIGMGPRIWSKKIGDTVFALSAIPLGGYVEIAGAEEVGQGEQKEAKRRDKHSFAVKPYWQKVLVMFGGILFNMIFAYTTFIALFMTGIPKTPIIYPLNAQPTIEQVIPNSAAEKYNLQSGDTILAINDISIGNDTALLLDQIGKRAVQPTTLTIERNGNKQTVDLIIGSNMLGNQKNGALGVIFKQVDIAPQPFMAAITLGIMATNLTLWRVWQTIKIIFTQKSVASVGGPLQVIAETIKGARKGLKVFLALLAFISVNLALLNIIPIPIMDGGQILFYTIEAIIRRPLPERVKLIIHYICWIGILLLTVYLSIKDVLRWFN